MLHADVHRLFSSQPPPPLFIYNVTPDEVSTSTGTDKPITLNVGIFNPKVNGFVKCDYILLGIAIGKGARDMTNVQADVQGQSNQKHWNIQKQPYQSSPLMFKLTPAPTSPPTTGLGAGESISFKLTGINVNDVEGTTPIYIAENSEKQRIGQALINKSSPSLQINYFRASPSSIQPGQQSTLSWDTTGASRCEIGPLANSLCPDAPPPNPLPTTGQIQVCPQQNLTVYTLTAYSPGGGWKTMPAPLTLNAVQIQNFTASPMTVDAQSPTSKLEWKVLNATKLTLDPGNIDVTGKTAYDVKPQNALGYTLTARGEGSLDTKVANVYVTPPDIGSFTSSPAEFVRGQPVTLAWATTHASSCSIDQGVGPVQPAASGSAAVKLQEQTSYTLTASGLGQPATKSLLLTPQPRGWKQMTSPQTAPPYVLGLSFKDKLWMIDTILGRVSSSTDGTSWTTVTSQLPISRRSNSVALVFNDGQGEKMWVMGGLWANSDHDRGLYNDVWSSADGVNWTQVKTSNVWSPRAWHRAVVFQGKMWILGGGISVGAPPYWGKDVWSSPDGVNWTQATASAQWSPRMEFGAAVFSPSSSPSVNQIWICGGSDTNNNPLAEAWYTNDGATWTRASVPWSGRDRCNLLMLNDKLWMLGGINNVNIYTVLPEMWVMDANMQWSQLPDRLPYDQSSLNYLGIASGVFKWRAWLNFTSSALPLYFYNP